MRGLIKSILQIMRRMDCIILYIVYSSKCKIQTDKVLFLSDSREDISGNFRQIYDQIKDIYTVKHYLGAQSRKNKKQFCKDIAEAAYVIVDDFYPVIYPIPLRKETRLIQVWHAMGAFKTVGYARKQNHDRFSMTHRNYTDAICSSEYIRKDYARAFRMDIKDVHGIGVPRTDVFFDLEYIEKKKSELYERYPILKEKKVILFAPTFRGNNIHNAYYDYEQMDFKCFRQEFSDEYVCILKMHPFVKNKHTGELDSAFYLDLSSEREINDLLFVTDILITDYSSVIFEASLLNIKTVFFAYDLEEYIEERDFFYPYEEYTYGPVVRDFYALMEVIKNLELDMVKLEEFKKKFASGCDGKATERFIMTLLCEKKNDE